NVLGDALTGWGVFPVWCIGNGLMGMIPGLVWAFRDRKQALNVVVGIVAGVLVLLSVLMLMFPQTEGIFFSGTVEGLWWTTLLGAAVVVGVRFLLGNREDIVSAQMWGALGIVIGIGFAAIANMWTDGYTFAVTILGQFLPAAGSNLIMTIVLLPILMVAWESARGRAGR
nr:hypothetical protein [Chloroflexaceae bacterium]